MTNWLSALFEKFSSWLLGPPSSGIPKPPLAPNNKMDEGSIHSGPGGYEDGNYIGGYAADYFADGDHHEH